MFPPPQEEAIEIGLHNTMRILPHDQNSGGFFVALLRKNQDFEWKYESGKNDNNPNKNLSKEEE